MPSREQGSRVLRDLAIFVALNAFVFVVTLMIHWPPHVLVWVMYVSLFFLIGDQLSRPALQRRARQLLKRASRHLPEGQSLAWMVAFVAMAILLPFRAACIRELYATGTFGEPPHNRFIRFTSSVDGKGGPFKFLAEVGVRSVAVEGINIGIAFMNDAYRRNETRVEHWSSKPGMMTVIPEADRRQTTEGYRDTETSGGFLFRSDQFSITPSQSFYVYMEGDRPFWITGCYVRSYFQGENDEGQCFTGEVAVYPATGIYVAPLPLPPE